MLSDHHDDFGGLHRDLLATGSAINRRQALRAAATFGVSIAGLQLLGCSDSTGKITFRWIFPACYQGRWPHIWQRSPEAWRAA